MPKRLLSTLAALALCGALPARAADPSASVPRSSPGFDVAALDRQADPCADFFQFACGAWNKQNPIPSDESSWGRFNELADRNRTVLREILEQNAADDPRRPLLQRQIGDTYAACMDEAGAEQAGSAPLKPYLDRIAALQDLKGLPTLLAYLHQNGLRALFNFGAAQDAKDASMSLASLDQGGLGLPDRDYYLKDDAKSVELRAKYREHVQKTFVLLGESAEQAAADAGAVLELETGLARISMERVKRRIPENRYNKRTTAELAALVPSFDWAAYFAAAGAPAFTKLNLVSLPFFEGLEAQWKGWDAARVRTYLRWTLARSASPLLSAQFVNEDFDFYGRTLNGAKELRPRWKRCVAQTDGDLGEALGRVYVEKEFGAEGKARMQQMVAALEKALERNVRGLPWMTDATRQKALEKLHAISNNIGYPESWRDYSTLVVKRHDAPGNAARANALEWARDMKKIDKPADRKEWRMSPPTVNAFYQPTNNSINFPAGILQPPFFDKSMDDAVNFGAIGAVIGHELTHGFDDSGRKFAGDGNLTDWWSEADGKEFERRVACVADQYSGYTAVEELKLNGRLTLGENVADNGGVRIALMALQDTLAGQSLPPRDGFTTEQRFFLGFAQIWCNNTSEEALRLRTATNPHSPGEWRVNCTLSNSPEFAQAFGCKAGQAMVRENACRVW